MATPTKIHLTLDTMGIVKNKPQTEETAAKASELLQENHEVHRFCPFPTFPQRHI
jgi:hypothetical protein